MISCRPSRRPSTSRSELMREHMKRKRRFSDAIPYGPDGCAERRSATHTQTQAQIQLQLQVHVQAHTCTIRGKREREREGCTFVLGLLEANALHVDVIALLRRRSRVRCLLRLRHVRDFAPRFRERWNANPLIGRVHLGLDLGGCDVSTTGSCARGEQGRR